MAVRERQPAVRMMASGRGGTLHVGVTSDLARRVAMHREKAIPRFTARHGCTALVWHALSGSVEWAIGRETQIKSGRRARKIGLVEAFNPLREDPYPAIIDADG